MLFLFSLSYSVHKEQEFKVREQHFTTALGWQGAFYQGFTLFAGLNGKTKLDKARCDMLCDGVGDIMSNFATFFLEKDETKKVTS